MKYSVDNYGEMLLGFLHEVYTGSYYDDDLEYNGDGWELHSRLLIDETVSVVHREWAYSKNYLCIPKRYKGNYLQLDLSNLIISGDQYSWYLSEPTDESTLSIFKKLLSGMVQIPESDRAIIKAQKEDAALSDKKIKVDKKAYPLAVNYSITEFQEAFINLISQILRPLTKNRPVIVKNYNIDSKEALEGYKSDRSVVTSARNSEIVLARKQKDNLQCQVCGFHFQLQGQYIIECHHLNPLASGTRITSMDEIISLCPTCHRMVHTKTPAYSPDELKKLLHKKN